MKTAVDRVGVGKKRDANARFMAMTNHYVFESDFCNPAAGWEKGRIGKNARDMRHRLWQVMPAFPDLDTLNLWLEDRCKALWTETALGSLSGSIVDVREAEKPELMPLPMAFDGYVEQSKRVSPTCPITFDRNRCSVPAGFANRPFSLHIHPERLVIVAEGHVVCEHRRIIERSHRHPGRVIYGLVPLPRARHCPQTVYGWPLGKSFVWARHSGRSRPCMRRLICGLSCRAP